VGVKIVDSFQRFLNHNVVDSVAELVNFLLHLLQLKPQFSITLDNSLTRSVLCATNSFSFISLFFSRYIGYCLLTGNRLSAVSNSMPVTDQENGFYYPNPSNSNLLTFLY